MPTLVLSHTRIVKQPLTGAPVRPLSGCVFKAVSNVPEQHCRRLSCGKIGTVQEGLWASKRGIVYLPCVANKARISPVLPTKRAFLRPKRQGKKKLSLYPPLARPPARSTATG